ncbi:MAG: flagellar basal body L-ring protein FlgH [Epsilonproteobacteria bacterium]|nr:flagellar basal body L-ring protein FlgH [Campylobacterota bacterium]
MIKPIFQITLAIFLGIFISGCTASLTDPEIDFEPPTYVEQMPALEEKHDYVATGSIFGQGDNPLFSDHKAMHVNDIVRVVISEKANSSNNAAKQLSGSDNSDLGGGTFVADGDSGAVSSIANKLNGISNIGFKTKSTSSFKGQGSVTNNASFTTTISARIVKILKNGNYFISGRREIMINSQKQLMQITGVIRPYDIDQYNKIDSSQISDAKILYKTQGDIDHATKQGWGTKIIQSVWPF